MSPTSTSEGTLSYFCSGVTGHTEPEGQGIHALDGLCFIAMKNELEMFWALIRASDVRSTVSLNH